MPDDGNRYEVVWGELLVTPSPVLLDQRVLGRLFRQIADYCDAHELGEAFCSPADISWGPDILVQPDIFVVAPSDANAVRWDAVKTLRLVVEILSPSTARQDRFTKRKLYQAEGVDTVWLVDTVRRSVEIWRPDSTFGAVESERVVWHPSGATEPLTVELARLFA